MVDFVHLKHSCTETLLTALALLFMAVFPNYVRAFVLNTLIVLGFFRQFHLLSSPTYYCYEAMIGNHEFSLDV